MSLIGPQTPDRRLPQSPCTPHVGSIAPLLAHAHVYAHALHLCCCCSSIYLCCVYPCVSPNLIATIPLLFLFADPDPMDLQPQRPTGLACEAVQLPGAVEAGVEQHYEAELGPLSIGEYDSTVPGGFSKEVRLRHSFAFAALRA